MPAGAAYVGRPTTWGNPFRVGVTQVRMPGIDGQDWEHEGRLHKTSGERHAFVHSSGFGEPFRQTWHQVENASAEQCVQLFAEYVGSAPLEHLDHPRHHLRAFRSAARKTLAGRDLVCWCPLDQPCHADVLLKLANGDGQWRRPE